MSVWVFWDAMLFQCSCWHHSWKSSPVGLILCTRFFYFGPLSCLYKFKWWRVVLLKLKTCTCTMKCLLSEKKRLELPHLGSVYCQAFTPFFLGIFCHASVPEVLAKVFIICTTLWKALCLFFLHVCMWIAYIFCCVYGCAVSYISTIL